MNVYVQVKWDRRLGIPWQSTCALTLANALKFLPLRTQGKVVHQELAVPCGIHSRTALRGLRVWNYFRKACLTSLGMTAFQELVFLKGMRMNWCTFAFFRVIFKFFFTRYVWDAYIHRMGWQISPIYGSCCVCLGGGACAWHSCVFHVWIFHAFLIYHTWARVNVRTLCAYIRETVKTRGRLETRTSRGLITASDKEGLASVVDQNAREVESQASALLERAHREIENLRWVLIFAFSVVYTSLIYENILYIYN